MYRFGSSKLSPFAAMDRELRARIGTARLLLERLAHDPTEHASASRAQCNALVNAVRRAGRLQLADKASLAELAQHVPWEASDAATIASAFSDIDAASEEQLASRRSRHSLQDFQNIHNFFLESEWACLVDSKASMTVRLDVIINRCISLSLRNPNELTLKHMTAILCVLGDGADSLHTHRTQDKTHMLLHVKQHFRSVSRRAGPAHEHIRKLPACFADLQHEDPHVASSAFPGEEPCQCPIDVRLLHSAGQSFRCRGGCRGTTHAEHLLGLSGGADQASTNGPNVLDQMQKFAMVMVQGMATMQEQQSKMFEMIGAPASASHPSFHSRAAASLTCGPTGAVPTLHLGSTLGNGFARALTFESPRTSSNADAISPMDSPRIGSEADGPAESTEARASVMGSPRIDSHADAPADSPLAKADESSSQAVDGACSLLKAIEIRDREKLQGKALAKAKSKGESSTQDIDSSFFLLQHSRFDSGFRSCTLTIALTAVCRFCTQTFALSYARRLLCVHIDSGLPLMHANKYIFSGFPLLHAKSCIDSGLPLVHSNQGPHAQEAREAEGFRQQAREATGNRHAREAGQDCVCQAHAREAGQEPAKKADCFVGGNEEPIHVQNWRHGHREYARDFVWARQAVQVTSSGAKSRRALAAWRM